MYHRYGHYCLTSKPAAITAPFLSFRISIETSQTSERKSSRVSVHAVQQKDSCLAAELRRLRGYRAVRISPVDYRLRSLRRISSAVAVLLPWHGQQDSRLDSRRLPPMHRSVKF